MRWIGPGLSSQKDPRKRLIAIRPELARLAEERRVLDEQVAFLQGVADDAEGQAAVAGTPLAERERHAAVEDLRRARRSRDQVVDRISALRAEQDALLERLL